MPKLSLIVDCGATSAKLATLGDEIVLHQLPGFNPHHHDWKEFERQIQYFASNLDKKVANIKFYGTGMGQPIYQNRMQGVLGRAFHLAEENIKVYSDLMICAHAAYNDGPVIIGILGTGSNIGFYDGKDLERITPSLGYLLGDEGSGVDIGKRLLKAFMYKQLPKEVSETINSDFNLHIDEVLEQTYTKNNLRSLASSLAPLASKYYYLEQIKSIIDQALIDFIDNRMVLECQARPAHSEITMYGSVAHVFRAALSRLVKSKLDKDVKIYKAPLQVLIDKISNK